MKMVLFLILLSLVIASSSRCLDNPKSIDNSEKTIVLGENAWLSSSFNVWLAKYIIEDRMGVPVNITDFQESLMGETLSTNQIDACLEIWGKEYSEVLPFIENSSVLDAGLLGVVGRIGWYAPDYMLTQFPFIPALASASDSQKADFFQAVNYTLIFGPQDWISYEEVIISKNNYNLTIQYTANEVELVSLAKQKYALHENFVFYLWTPHSIFVAINITRVGLPTTTDSCENGPIEEHSCDYPQVFLRKAFWPGLSNKNKHATQFLTAITLSNKDHINALAEVDLHALSIEEVACNWVRENENIWSTWIPQTNEVTWKIIVGVLAPAFVLISGLIGAALLVNHYRKRARVLSADNLRLKGLMKVNLLNTPAERVLGILDNIRHRKNRRLAQNDIEDLDYVIAVIASRKLDRVATEEIKDKGTVDHEVMDFLYDTILRRENEEQNFHQTSMSSLSARAGTNLQDVSECESILAQIEQWNFDTLIFNQATGGHALRSIATHLFGRYNLMQRLSLNPSKFGAFLEVVESKYNANNEYHNSAHAADVVQVIHLLMKAQLEHFADIQVLSLLFAGIIHDMEHVGKNNNFLIATKNPLAIIYNDTSVLENMHIAKAFALLEEPQYNFLAELPPDQYSLFRKLVIQLVLATDMSNHIEILSDFKSKMSIHACDFDANPECLLCLMKMIIKCADIFNTGRPWDICQKWAMLATQEFFKQGDEEKGLGLTVSPMMDRNHANIPKLQMTFIDFVTLPMAESVVKSMPIVNQIAEQMKFNRDSWEALSKKRINSAYPSTPTTTEQQPTSKVALTTAASPATVLTV